MIKSAIQLVKKESSHQYFAARIQRKYARAGLLGWKPLSLVFRVNAGIMRQEDALLSPLIINFQWQLAKLWEQKNSLQVLQHKYHYLLDRSKQERFSQGETLIPPAIQHYYNSKNHIDSRQDLIAPVTSIYREKILERLVWEAIREVNNYSYLNQPGRTPGSLRAGTGAAAGRWPDNPRYPYEGVWNRAWSVGETGAAGYPGADPTVYFIPRYRSRSRRKAAAGSENQIIRYIYKQTAFADASRAVSNRSPKHWGKNRLLQELIKIEQTKLISSKTDEKEHSAKTEHKIKLLLRQLLLWQVTGSRESQETPGYFAQIQRKDLEQRQKNIPNIIKKRNIFELLGNEQVKNVEYIKGNYTASNAYLTGNHVPGIAKTGQVAQRSDLLAILVYLKPKSFNQSMPGRRQRESLTRYEEESGSPNRTVYREKLLERWIRQSINQPAKQQSLDGIDKNALGQLSLGPIINIWKWAADSNWYAGGSSAVRPDAEVGVLNYPKPNPFTYLIPSYSRASRQQAARKEKQINIYADHQAVLRTEAEALNNRSLNPLEKTRLLREMIKIEQIKYLSAGTKVNHPGQAPGSKIELLLQQLFFWQLIKAQEPQVSLGSNGASIKTAAYSGQVQQKIARRWSDQLISRIIKGNHHAVIYKQEQSRRVRLEDKYPVSEPAYPEQNIPEVQKAGRALQRRDMLAILVYLKPGIFRQSILGNHRFQAVPATQKLSRLNSDYRVLVQKTGESTSYASELKRLERSNKYNLRQLSNSIRSTVRPGPDQPGYKYDRSRKAVAASAEDGTVSARLNVNLYLALPYRRPGSRGTSIKSPGEVVRYLDNSAMQTQQSREMRYETRRYPDKTGPLPQFSILAQSRDGLRLYQDTELLDTRKEPKLEQLLQELRLWQLIKAQEAGPLAGISQAEGRIYHFPGSAGQQTIERWQTLIHESISRNSTVLLKRAPVQSSAVMQKFGRGQEPVYPDPHNRTADKGEQAGARSYIWSLLVYLKPGLAKQFMLEKRRPRAVAGRIDGTRVLPASRQAGENLHYFTGEAGQQALERWQTLIYENISRKSEAPMRLGFESARSSNNYRVEIFKRLIIKSINENSGLKLLFPKNEVRSRRTKKQGINTKMPMPISTHHLNAEGLHEDMAVGQTGASSYLSLNPFSIGRNCGAVSTHRCNEVGDYNRSPVLLTGTRAFKAGDIFSPRYIYLSLQYRAPGDRDVRLAGAREITRYIENRVQVLNQGNTARHEFWNYLDRTSTLRTLINHQKQEYRLKYSPEKEREKVEGKIEQLVRELTAWQWNKMPEARRPQGSSEASREVYRYPAQTMPKTPDRVQNIILERIIKKTNPAWLLQSEQARRGEQPLSPVYAGEPGSKVQRSLNIQAIKKASDSNILKLPDYARPEYLQPGIMQQNVSESLESVRSRQRSKTVNIETSIIHDIRELGIKTLQKQLRQEKSKADRPGSRSLLQAEGQVKNILSFRHIWMKQAEEYKISSPDNVFKDQKALLSSNAFVKLAADLSLNHKQAHRQVSNAQPAAQPRQEIITSIDSAVQQEAAGKNAAPVSRLEIKRIADQVFQELEQRIKHERQRRGLPG